MTRCYSAHEQLVEMMFLLWFALPSNCQTAVNIHTDISKIASILLIIDGGWVSRVNDTATRCTFCTCSSNRLAMRSPLCDLFANNQVSLSCRVLMGREYSSEMLNLVMHYQGPILSPCLVLFPILFSQKSE